MAFAFVFVIGTFLHELRNLPHEHHYFINGNVLPRLPRCFACLFYGGVKWLVTVETIGESGVPFSLTFSMSRSGLLMCMVWLIAKDLSVVMTETG